MMKSPAVGQISRASTRRGRRERQELAGDIRPKKNGVLLLREQQTAAANEILPAIAVGGPV
jgi:hypothetical protein